MTSFLLCIVALRMVPPIVNLSNVLLILLSGYLKQMHKKGEDKVVIIHVNEMTRSIGKLIIIVLLT